MVSRVGSVCATVISLDGEWLLAPDPENGGRQGAWWERPAAGAVATRVPWIIQHAFPGYHGVAWYWRELVIPANPQDGGRTLLRFGAVDYLADVWLNGTHVGAHEGGETPFVLDVTECARPGQLNLLAVRVLNPTHEPIDGIVLNETPHRNKVMPYTAGGSYNHGGIVGPVELILAPAVRIEDLFVRPDTRRGALRVQVTVRNAGAEVAEGQLQIAAAPAAQGETVASAAMACTAPVGDTSYEVELVLPSPRQWELNDPYLYRVSTRVTAGGGASFDERSVRCGLRGFQFERGHFRLNGRRLFLRCSHTGNHCPIGLQVPHDPDLLRRDLLNVKAMGFNAIRFIAGLAIPWQLDLCDELGLMVYEESYAGWCLADSPRMGERFDRATREMIRRDRNHPSVVLWGLLNETPDGPVFRHAVDVLPLVRALDDSRMVALGSGRWDGQLHIGSFSNPGSTHWDVTLGGEGPGAAPTRLSSPGGYCEKVGDAHAYPRVPHLAETIRFLRELGRDTGPVFLSEYGIGSAVDLVRVVRHYERLGQTDLEDARFYREQLARFLGDWERWQLADTFGRPEDYFDQCLRKMAGQRLLGLNAIRSNPQIVGYSLTGTVDQGMTGEGLTTTFRELKPGTMDALFDGLAPLRWCLFAEPPVVARGDAVRLEAVLANEDMLPPGEYPARLQVFGPDMGCLLDQTVHVPIPEPAADAERPLATEVLSTELVASGGEGRYRFVATFAKGAAAAGGEALFHVMDPAAMPAVEAEVVLWGEDALVWPWLVQHGVRTRRFVSGEAPERAVILAGATPPPGGEAAFRELAYRIAQGSTAVFLSTDVFRRGDDPVGWVPLERKGRLADMVGWLYLKDEWAKKHPILDGLPSGGLLDTWFYRDLIPDAVWSDQEPPAEAVAGAINAAQGYSSGLMMAVHRLGAGRLLLNTLRIRETLGVHPAAERLLRNVLRWAADGAGGPTAPLPPRFEGQLRAMGYGASG